MHTLGGILFDDYRLKDVRTSMGLGMGTLVVGIDGSDEARAAARWGVKEAGLRGARLRLVTAWRLPLTTYGGEFASMSGGVEGDLERAARATVEEAVHQLGDTSAVAVETRVREGQPALVLVEEANGAELLIVGSRGLGGFRGLLLGSVSAQCAQHARCPVVIVRVARDDDRSS